jgi:hypothetical protein
MRKFLLLIVLCSISKTAEAGPIRNVTKAVKHAVTKPLQTKSIQIKVAPVQVKAAPVQVSSNFLPVSKAAGVSCPGGKCPAQGK